MWYVYILRCKDGTLYTGVTTNVARRFLEHANGKVGAKYTRARKPESIVYTAPCKDRSTALKEEARIKRLSRTEKQALITP
jgi:putative endonuclease